jgi:hypothetical protein
MKQYHSDTILLLLVFELISDLYLTHFIPQIRIKQIRP